jgi:GTPase
MASKFRAGFVGMLGLPNAGKSTLTNTIVNEKLAGVSSKPQTTRNKIMGIHTTPEAQFIFLDGPGWVRGDTALNKFLEYEFQSVIDESDVLLIHFNIDEDKKIKIG